MKKTIIIGSLAAKSLWSDFRDVKDIDVAYEKQEDIPTKEIKYDDPCIERYVIPPLFKHVCAEQDMLYTLKVSHVFWSKVHFDKTMHDIEFMKKKGAVLHEELYKDLYKHWEQVHGKKTITLDKTNEEFFKDKLKRTMDHDTLHEWMAYGDRPVYESLKKDKSKALIDKDMFFALPKEKQLQCCREEIAVIALEKWIIPSGMKESSIIAWRKSYKHLVTVITKGWFARYLVENYSELKKPDYDYKKKFEDRCKDERYKFSEERRSSESMA